MKNLKSISKFSLGLLTGILGTSLIFSTFAIASNPIKLIVNNQEIQCDVPPQNINGRVLVPIRAIGESLNCTVEWDEVNNAVIVTGGVEVNAIPSDLNTVGDTEKNNTNITPTPISNPVVNNLEEDSIKETTFNGLKAIEKNGKIYFLLDAYFEKVRMANPDNTIDVNMRTRIINIVINGEKSIIPLLNEDAVVYKDFAYFDTKYYLEY